MTEASIPVDIFNPGQVFACMGFLEAADVLCGDAEGGFDWDDPADVRFCVKAKGNASPVETVLGFLAKSEIEPLDTDGDIEFSPNRQDDKMALPIFLRSGNRSAVCLDHWADGSSRESFKLYAGNRSAYSIACAMLGTRERSKRNQSVDDAKTSGVAALWDARKYDLLKCPFDITPPVGGSFNFDPRGAWTSIDAGYSPNTQNHGVEASPVVEILAAWGLQNARPNEYENRRVRYGAWKGFLVPMLARPALAGIDVAVPLRKFKFALDLSGKNKVVTFAQEEITND